MRLTRKDFKAWLEGLHPRTKVARTYELGMYFDPIEKYVRSNGNPDFVENGTTNLPVWATKFLAAGSMWNDSMSAGRALNLLEETSGRAAVGTA